MHSQLLFLLEHGKTGPLTTLASDNFMSKSQDVKGIPFAERNTILAPSQLGFGTSD